MKLKENENIPNAEFFILEDGSPVKKNTLDFFKKKKDSFVWIARGIYFSLFSKALTKLCR